MSWLLIDLTAVFSEVRSEQKKPSPGQTRLDILIINL
jgi:hypothetical protein